MYNRRRDYVSPKVSPSMLALWLQSAGYAFTAAAVFGPLQVLLMNVTLAHGWRAGIAVALSPLATDAIIVPLMLFLLDQLPPLFAPILQIIGGFVVFFIAWRTFQDARKPAVAATIAAANLSRQSLIKGMLINFANPNPYLFWGTITGPLLLQAFRQSIFSGIGFLVTFYGIFVGSMVILVFVFERARGISPRAARALTLFSVAILVVLGLGLVWQGINGLGTVA